MEKRPRPTGKVQFYNPPRIGQTTAVFGGTIAATAATLGNKAEGGNNPTCIRDARIIMGAGHSQKDSNIQMASLAGKLVQDYEDDEDDEIVLRPCDACHALVWWYTGGHEKPVCKNCKRVQGGENAEVDYHAGYEGEKPVNMQGDAVNMVMRNGNPAGLEIAAKHGSFGLRMTQRGVDKLPYWSRKLVIYGVLINEALAEMKINTDPKNIRPAVLAAFKSFNEKKEKRTRKKVEVHILARELHNALISHVAVGQAPVSQTKLAEIMQKKFDATFRDSQSIMEPKMTFASAAKLQQLTISTDSKLKTQSNVSSALALIKVSKAYVKESFPSEFSPIMVDAIARTFIQMQNELGHTFRRATMLTVGPALLTLAKRRHGFIEQEDELDRIKKTSRKHIIPMLSSGAHVPPTQNSVNCVTPTLRDYLKQLAPKTDDDTMEISLRSFESAVAFIVSPLQQYLAILHVKRMSPSTSMSEYKEILQADDLKGLKTSAKLIFELKAGTSNACQDVAWSRMVDPRLVSNVKDAVSNVPTERHKADAVFRSLNSLLQRSARFVDLAAIVCAMKKIGMDRTDAVQRLTSDFGLSEDQSFAVTKLSKAMAHKMKVEEELLFELEHPDTGNDSNHNSGSNSSGRRLQSP